MGWMMGGKDIGGEEKRMKVVVDEARGHPGT